MHFNHLRQKTSLETRNGLCFEAKGFLFIKHFRLLYSVFVEDVLTLIRILYDTCKVRRALFSRPVALINKFWMVHICMRSEEKTLSLPFKPHMLFHRHRLRTFSYCYFLDSCWIESLPTEIDDLAARSNLGNKSGCLSDALVIFNRINVDLPSYLSVYLR